VSRLPRIKSEPPRRTRTRQDSHVEPARPNHRQPVGQLAALGNATIQRMVRRAVQRQAAPGAYPMLKVGSTGQFVSALQTLLNEAGESLAADGIFGPLTRTAVRTFQAGSSLAADGIVGPMTWGALETRTGQNAGEVASGLTGASGPSSAAGGTDEAAFGSVKGMGPDAQGSSGSMVPSDQAALGGVKPMGPGAQVPSGSMVPSDQAAFGGVKGMGPDAQGSSGSMVPSDQAALGGVKPKGPEAQGSSGSMVPSDEAALGGVKTNQEGDDTGLGTTKVMGDDGAGFA
jgi:hypothetical protein